MPTYDGEAEATAVFAAASVFRYRSGLTAATCVFASLSAARDTHGAASVAPVAFASTVTGHVTYTGHSAALAAFAVDVNPEIDHTFDAQGLTEAQFLAEAHPGKTVNASSDSKMVFEGEGNICSAAYGLQVKDAIDAIFSVWGMTCRDNNCQDPAGEEAVNCLNAAFQKLHSSGKAHQFVRRVTRKLELTAVNSAAFSYGIGVGQDVQSVCAPVELVYADPAVITPGTPTVNVIAISFSASGAYIRCDGVDDPLYGDTGVLMLASMAANAQFTALYTAVSATVAPHYIVTITAKTNGPTTGEYAPGRIVYAISGLIYLNGETNGTEEVVDTPETETSRRMLRPLASLAAFRSFNAAYLDTSLAVHQEPLAYFVEQNCDTSIGTLIDGNSPDPNETVIQLAPRDATTSSYKSVSSLCYLHYDAILKPTRFSCQFPSVRLPVAQTYAETLLIPLAKWYSLASRYFDRPEIKPSIEAQAAEVLKLLGEVSPSPQEVPPT